MSKYTTHDSPQDIPYGYCQCGCGQKAPITKRFRPKQGILVGQPQRYIRGHRPTEPFPRRFWKHVDKQGNTECWLWKGWKTVDGWILQS